MFRDLTVGNTLDGDLHAVAVRGGGEGVAALGTVAVGGGEPDVDVLAREVSRPAGEVEDERAGRRCLVAELGEPGLTPR